MSPRGSEGRRTGLREPKVGSVPSSDNEPVEKTIVRIFKHVYETDKLL